MMIKVFGFISFLIIIISSCLIKHTNNNYKICNCCNQTYTNIDSAINCISNYPKTETTSDNRLLLFAFVNKDIIANQNKGWDIIEDSEIIKIAKRNYLLVIIDAKNIDSKFHESSKELNNVIKNYNDDLFFVIANQALYPFADWTLNDDKEMIIDNLKVGNGP